jgi:hypothetical protein
MLTRAGNRVHWRGLLDLAHFRQAAALARHRGRWTSGVILADTRNLAGPIPECYPMAFGPGGSERL